MRKIYLLLSLLIAAIATPSLGQEYIPIETGHKQVELSYTISYDTIKELDVNQFYNMRYSVNNLSGKTYSLFYNKTGDHYFDLCEGGAMQGCLRIKPAFIDSIYRNEDERIYAVYMHTPDSLFAITDSYIYMFNKQGATLSKIDFKSPLKKQFSRYSITFGQKEKPFYYYAPTHSFYISVMDNTINKGVAEAVKKQIPLFLRFDITSAKWEAADAPYSKLFSKNDFGMATEYYSSYTGTAILYNFQVEPNIYKYMPGTNTLEVIGGASLYADSIPKGFKNRKQDRDFMFNWFVRIPKYDSPVMYDPFKNLYYRVFYKGIPVKSSTGLYNTQWDKGAVVMVFDTDFNVVKEIEFNPGLFSCGKPFVSEKGLHVDLRTKSVDQPKVYAIIDVK